MAVRWPLSAFLHAVKIPFYTFSSLALVKEPSKFTFPNAYISSYVIEDKRTSEHATVFFTRQKFSRKSTLMKVLHEYKDTRYSQETVEKRQRYQLEALRRNRAFSPEIYLGLATIQQQDLQQSSIRIGEIFQCPTPNDLKPGFEYALIMRKLPEERNLVFLLKQQDDIACSQHINILTEHVAHIHKQLITTQPTEDEKRWGTYQQLEEKLLHNFGLLDLILETLVPSMDYNDVRKKISWLKETLSGLFGQENYRNYFDQRLHTQRIRLCHGDLKSPNIWILPYKDRSKRDASHFVKILDAIDFNPTYCNIDILSDFAMLAIDIQTRTGSMKLATEMIEYYLKLTGQTDDGARAILNYYLIEKAFVGAAISIVYDNAPELGLNLLKIAVERLQSLLAQQDQIHIPVIQLVR